LRTSIQMSRSFSFSVCSSMTYSARSSDMPDLDHRRELARPDHEIVRRDLLEAREDVAGVGPPPAPDVDDDQAARAQLRRDGLLVGRLDLALAGEPPRSSALNA
jgi:hypothetical protein